MSDINVTVNDQIVNVDVQDEPVIVSVVNSPGQTGAPGQGVAIGGTTGQVLAKASATNYDTQWVNPSGSWGTITGTLSGQTDLYNALNAKFDDPTGTTSQYLRGDGSLATFPTITSGTVTSVGLSMPSAFTVSGSPVTSSGTLAVTATGTTLQYLRGDGTLATFPTLTNGTVTSVGLSSATSGVTIGSSPITTSGTITLAIATASGSQNGLLSSTDWTTFNGKQNTLTNPITGTGASGQVAYFTGASTQAGNNNLFWDITNGRLGIGLSNQQATLQVGTKLGSGANVYSFSGYGFGVENGTSRFIGGEVTAASQTTTAIDIVLGGSAAWGNSTTRLTFSGFDRGNAFNAGILGSIGIFKPSGLNSLGDGNLVFGTTLSGSSTPTERMRLTAVGRLILGAGDSGELLQVNGTMKVTGASTFARITSSVSGITFEHNVGILYHYGGSGDYIQYISGANYLMQNRTATGSLQLGTNSTTRLTIASDGAATFSSSVQAGGGTTNASAILQADSTTKGFLPPRMTTAQINAIATPSEGLQVYNTTINHMCFYQAGAWAKISHSPM